MEVLTQIEQACKDNNHGLNISILDSVESEELKKQAFLKIIDYYEKVSQIPYKYYIHFIEWLLKNGDINTAKNYILKCNNLEIGHEEISELIYEYIIKPDESQYRQRFDKNLELLLKYDLLFSELTFDFEDIKESLFLCANDQAGFGNDLIAEQKTAYLLVDVISLELIQKLLEVGHTVYLIYGDLNKFYYMLLFEDLSRIDQYIRESKIVCFPDGDVDILHKFLLNVMLYYPINSIDLTTHKKYQEMVNDIFKLKTLKTPFYIKKMNAIYKSKNYQYYSDLFLKPPSDIKILLVTSRSTELNNHICRSWYNAFVELGYSAMLIIESKPYENMTMAKILEQMYDFQPDAVFFINQAFDSVFNVEGVRSSLSEVKKSLLWIMRYRDFTDISYKKDINYEQNNMFVIPFDINYLEDLKQTGAPQNRVLYVTEGIDLNVFKIRESRSERHSCDVVSVNNSGGDEFYRFKCLLNQTKDKELKQIFHEVFADINEMAYREEFIFFDKSFEKLFDDKLFKKGIRIEIGSKKSILRALTNIMFALYRCKVMEWIIDSNITKKIKVWGRGWSNNEKIKSFHMGVAKHGEELSNIYRNSKISISDHPNISLHERAFEILASGGFPLAKQIEPENNEKVDSIANYFKENEEIALFYNKDDLLNKIQHYLENPEERERISGNGRNVVIRDFSNIAVAKRTMDFIKGYYSIDNVNCTTAIIKRQTNQISKENLL